MDITRNMNGARALVVGAGLALALAMGAAPTPAMAAGRVGTTKVMVRTEIDNVEFKVPTVIPFVAKADGTLQGPSEDATTIDNLSAYGVHVTNMKIDAMNTWTIAADAKAGTAQNSIDFKVGPDGALQNASAAMQGTGLDLSKNAAFDMGYQGIAGGTDKIKLKTSGRCRPRHARHLPRNRRRRSGCNDHLDGRARCAHGIRPSPWPPPSAS